jgi:predicted AlkP superfamily phosphohydrolase/phosphomutase
MSARILFIGLDACDPTLVRKWAAAGALPTLGRLLERGALARVENPYGLYVGSLWVTFMTARSAARSGFHCWDVVEPTTYERRLTSPREIAGVPFWEELSQRGRRVAVIDVPHSRAQVPVRGVQVVEWGCHDRHFGFHTQPAGLAADVEATVGLHPIFGVDAYAETQWAPDDYVHRASSFRTPDEEVALVDGLLEGADRKRRLSLHLLSRGDWDLFLSVFGESHAVGHQSWYVHDPANARHDPALRRRVGDPILRVYAALDVAVGELIAAAGDGASVFVLLSHGMGPHNDGTHLLDEALRRIEATDRDGGLGPGPRATAKRAWGRLPETWRRGLSPAAAAVLRSKVRRHPPPPTPHVWATAEDRARRRFFLSPNNFSYGGVRLNVRGRERAGLVEPGRDFDETCRRLADDLLALVNVEGGCPVLRSVSRTDAHHRREEPDLLPDLLLAWDQRAPIETIWSPKTGLLHGPSVDWRTGDHRPDGLLMVSGPGIEPADLGTVGMLDLGPTLCARLGVALRDVDGRPARALLDPGGHGADGSSSRGDVPMESLEAAGRP